MKVLIKKLRPDAILPTYAKFGDAGMDEVSELPASERGVAGFGSTGS